MNDGPSSAVELRAELVVQVILRLQAIGLVGPSTSRQDDCTRLQSLRGLVVRHDYTSDFEGACLVLQQAGVVAPSSCDGTLLADSSAWATFFVLKFDLPSLRDHLRGLSEVELPTLADTITAFLALTTCYGNDDRLSTSRKAHFPPAHLECAVALLIRNGFAETSGEGIVWTDLIGPMMQASHLWDEQNVCAHDRTQANLHNAWSTMPGRFRSTFFKAGEVDVVGLGFAIESYWYDGRWQKYPRNRNTKRKLPEPDAMFLARALEARSKGRL